MAFRKRRFGKRRFHRRAFKRRDWPNDFPGHKKASKLGWKRRRRARRDASGRDWPNDHTGHVKAGKLAWKRRRRRHRGGFKRGGTRTAFKRGYAAGFGTTYRRRGRPAKRRDADYDASKMRDSHDSRDPGPGRHKRRFGRHKKSFRSFRRD